MARLALGVAGGVIGASLGVPGLGFALGSFLGGVLFPGDGPPDQVREGQRIQDSKIQNSAYGVMKQILYGRFASRATSFGQRKLLRSLTKSLRMLAAKVVAHQKSQHEITHISVPSR